MKQRGFGWIEVIIILALIGVVVAVVVGIYHKGYAAGEAAVKLEWEQASAAQRAAEEKQGNTASAGLESDRAKDRVVVRTITQRVDVEVEKPVYRDVCLTPVGVCLANAAIRGADPDTCKPDGAVPGLRRPAGWNGRSGLALDYGDRGLLQGLPAKAQPPG